MPLLKYMAVAENGTGPHVPIRNAEKFREEQAYFIRPSLSKKDKLSTVKRIHRILLQTEMFLMPLALI